MTLIDPSLAPAGIPRPLLVHSGYLDVPDYPGSSTIQRYPVEVWRVSNGFEYAIVTDVPANRSLQNASRPAVAAIRKRWNVEGILEYWPDGSPLGQKFVWNSGGGHLLIDHSELEKQGLVLPRSHNPARR